MPAPPSQPIHSLPSDRVLTRDFWIAVYRAYATQAVRAAISILAIAVVYFLLRGVLFRLLDGILARLVAHETRIGAPEQKTARFTTLQGLAKSLLGYVLLFVFGVLLFNAVGFNILPFVETAGVVGLAIGFGAQKLVKDVISGFFIIVDDLFMVGDVVTINSMTGQVQSMGMRVTRLADSTGRIFMVANGDIGTVANLSRQPVRDVVEISVTGGTDVKKLEKLVMETGDRLAKEEGSHLQEPPRAAGVSAFSAAALTLRVSVMADPLHLPQEQMRVREALREALLTANIGVA